MAISLYTVGTAGDYGLDEVVDPHTVISTVGEYDIEETEPVIVLESKMPYLQFVSHIPEIELESNVPNIELVVIK